MDAFNERDYQRIRGARTAVPRWVKDFVERLARRNRELEAVVARLEAQLAGESGGSRFAVERGPRSEAQFLPGDARHVSWTGTAGGDADDWVIQFSDRSGDGSELEVMCTTWQGLVVVPQATNVIQVRPARTK